MDADLVCHNLDSCVVDIDLGLSGINGTLLMMVGKDDTYDQ